MLFIAVYMLLACIIGMVLFVELCHKNWQIIPSIIVVAMLLAMFIFITPGGGVI